MIVAQGLNMYTFMHLFQLHLHVLLYLGRPEVVNSDFLFHSRLCKYLFHFVFILPDQIITFYLQFQLPTLLTKQIKSQDHH